MKNKINMSSISNKINFIYGDECEKNTVGMIIFSDGTDYFFDAEYKNKMSNEELEALLLRGAVIFKNGKYYKPASFNDENVSYGGALVDPGDIEVDLSAYATKTFVNDAILNVQLGGGSNNIEPDAPNVGYIAHRGYSAIAPENTIPAYEEAGEAGFWGAETDIAETLDGEFVLMHDATVDRTTNGAGNVADMTLEQIKALTIDAGSNIAKYPDLKVPTLREYLTCCKRYNMVPIIECKTINNIEGFYNILQELNMVKQVIVISFQNGTLQALREFSKDIRIQTLSPGAVEAGIALCKQYNFDVDLNEVNVTEDVVKQYHNNGIKVNVWMVNNDTRRLELESFGVDYITTDNLISRKMKIFQSVKNHDATISDMQQTIDMLLKLVGSSTEDYGAMTEYVQRNYDITITGSKSDLLHSNGTKADAKFPSIYTSWSGDDYYKRAAYPFLFVGKKQIQFEFDDDYKISVHTFDTDGNRLTDGGWTTDSGSVITIPDELFGLFVARKDDAIFNLDYVNEFLSSLVITVIGSI